MGGGCCSGEGEIRCGGESLRDWFRRGEMGEGGERIYLLGMGEIGWEGGDQ